MRAIQWKLSRYCGRRLVEQGSLEIKAILHPIPYTLSRGLRDPSSANESLASGERVNATADNPVNSPLSSQLFFVSEIGCLILRVFRLSADGTARQHRSLELEASFDREQCRPHEPFISKMVQAKFCTLP